MICTNYCHNTRLRDRSQTLVRGAWCKKGPLKFLILVRGALIKITTDFPLKIEFTCFSMGLTHNFHGKKGGPEFFCGLKGGGGRKMFAINIFCIRPPLTSVCERSLNAQKSAQVFWHRSRPLHCDVMKRRWDADMKSSILFSIDLSSLISLNPFMLRFSKEQGYSMACKIGILVWKSFFNFKWSLNRILACPGWGEHLDAESPMQFLKNHVKISLLWTILALSTLQWMILGMPIDMLCGSSIEKKGGLHVWQSAFSKKWRKHVSWGKKQTNKQNQENFNDDLASLTKWKLFNRCLKVMSQ